MEVQNQEIKLQNRNQTQESYEKSNSKLSQIAFQTRSEQMDRFSERSSDSENQENKQRQKSTQQRFCLQNLSLKNIKSKEEIQIESKQNQTIFVNLNSNIDNLFKKISSLADQINTELSNEPPQQLKQKSITSIEQQNNKLSNFKERKSQKAYSSPKINIKAGENKKVQNFRQYKPIFFQRPQNNSKQYKLNMKLFQTGRSLGCGKFGQVVQCRNIQTNYLYALKKIFKSVIQQYGMQSQLLTELKVLSQIDHPNIVKAYESFTDDFHIFILMEYVQGVLLTKKFNSTEKQVKNIIRQVLDVLKYLHNIKIAHRDIKPENIILTADNIVKICDFGWAAQTQNNMHDLCGTLDYVSYQMVKQLPYTQKIDLWNVGVLTYELIYGYPPFKASSKQKIFEKVKNLDYAFQSQIQISQNCKDFITRFLKPQEERQTIQQALCHEFLAQSETQQLQKDWVINQSQDQFKQIQLLTNILSQDDTKAQIDLQN